jgi:hypothetical protein
MTRSSVFRLSIHLACATWSSVCRLAINPACATWSSVCRLSIHPACATWSSVCRLSIHPVCATWRYNLKRWRLALRSVSWNLSAQLVLLECKGTVLLKILRMIQKDPITVQVQPVQPVQEVQEVQEVQPVQPVPSLGVLGISVTQQNFFVLSSVSTFSFSCLLAYCYKRNGLLKLFHLFQCYSNQ